MLTQTTLLTFFDQGKRSNTLTGPLTTRGDYQIKFLKGVQEALFSLGSTHQAAFIEATTFLAEYAPKTPKKMMPPKLKELKGDYKGYYQFDFAGNHRLIYTVEDESKTVYVERCGPHPDWAKRNRHL